MEEVEVADDKDRENFELEASTILKTKKKKEKKRQHSGHYTTHEEVAEEDQQSGTEVRSLMEELEMAKSPDGAEVETEDLDGVEAEDGEDWRVHKAAGSLMEDLATAVDLEGAQNEAKGATNRQVAEDNQNTARVEQHPKKEVKVADSPDGAAEVVMEGLDGADGGTAGGVETPMTSTKKQRHKKNTGNSRTRRRNRAQSGNSSTTTATTGKGDSMRRIA